jgi:acetoacetyl-CoA synthetase
MGDASPHDAVELWRHSDPTSTRMYSFMQAINSKYALHLTTYEELYQWSINNIPEFWEETWHFTGITASKHFDKVK